MNTTFAVCALIMSGLVSQNPNELVAPTPQTIQKIARRAPSKQPAPRYASNRPTRTMSDNVASRPRMPLSPTDPRMFSDNCLPLPPTMDSAGPMPSANTVDARQRFVDAGLVENGNRRAPNERPFEHHQSPPAISPYMLMYTSTANGTISTYNTYVRPALAQRAALEEEEISAGQGTPGQGTPGYPSIYQNRGPYYPAEQDRY
jgi:hypothetical protein